MLTKEELKANVMTLATGGTLERAQLEETQAFLADLVGLFDSAEGWCNGRGGAESMQDIIARNQDPVEGERFTILQISGANDEDERFFVGRWMLCVTGNGFFHQGRRYKIARSMRMGRETDVYGLFHPDTKMVYTGEANDEALFVVVNPT